MVTRQTALPIIVSDVGFIFIMISYLTTTCHQWIPMVMVSIGLAMILFAGFMTRTILKKTKGERNEAHI